MATYIPGPGVLACKVGADTVVLDTVSGNYFRLDDVSAWVWEAALSRDDLTGLAEDLTAACEPGSAPELSQVRAEVTALVSDLLDRGLLAPAAG